MFLFLCVVALAVWLWKLHARVQELESRDLERQAAMSALETQTRVLASRLVPLRAREVAEPGADAAQPAASTPPAPSVPPGPPPRPEAPARSPQWAADRPGPTPPPPPAAVPPPPQAARPEASREDRSPAPIFRPSPGIPGAPAPASAALHAGAGGSARGGAVPPSRTVRPAAEPAPSFDWEALIGVKLFSWIAGIALALGAIFFLRYSIQAGWLQPPVRMAMGIATGLGLLAVCELKVARRYAVTANALDAAAVVILFSTFFASYRLWGLIGALPAFALLALVTAAAVLLSIRRDSLFIALLGLVGGFSTPALLSSGQDNPLGLFGYLLLLNAGLAWVTYRTRWVLLAALSLLFTTLYQWGWVSTFLTTAKLPLAFAIFLAFPLLAYGMLLGWGRGSDERDEGDPRDTGWIHPAPGSATRLLRGLAAANAALPLIFVLFLATAEGYGEEFWLLFGFLFLMDAGLFAIARWRGPQVLHVLGGTATLLVFLAWWDAVNTGSGSVSPSLPAVLTIVAGFALFYLGTGLTARHGGRRLDGPATLAVATSPALLVLFPLLAAKDAGSASPALLFATLFLLVAVMAVYAIVERAGFVYFIAAAMGVLTQAVWSVLQLAPERLLTAVTVYSVFGVVAIAVPLAARRASRSLQLDWLGDSLTPDDWTQAAQSFSLAAYFFLFVVATLPRLALPPWPLFAALAGLAAAHAAAALELRKGSILTAALAGSQIVMLAWLGTAGDGNWPTIGLAAVAALAGLGLACAVAARRLVAHAADVTVFENAATIALVLGQVACMVAGRGDVPSAGVLTVFHLLFLSGLLALAALSNRHGLALVAVVPASLAAWVWQEAHLGPAHWIDTLVLAAPVYLAFLAYPLLLGRRAGARIEPHLAAVLASAAFFRVARIAMIDGGLEPVLGLLPVVQALLTGVLLLALLELEQPGQRALGRLALVAGTLLAFVTVAIPLQLEKEWVTIGWALEGAALAWLFLRIPHTGLFWAATGLLGLVFVRLALNPEVFTYEPRGAMRIWNWYLYTYLVSAGATFAGSWLLSKVRERGEDVRWASYGLAAAGTILLFLLLNIEIADFYATGPTITFNLSATLAQDLTYTLAWALFAVALLTAGIVLGAHAARVAAIGLLTVTVLKGFLLDVSRLGGLYRVMSFVGLAICLSLVAVILQRFVLSARPGASK